MADAPPAELFDLWLRAEAERIEKARGLPADVATWAKRKPEVRRKLLARMRFEPPAMRPEPREALVHDILKRDGYRVEVLTIRTGAGRVMTASAYVPDGATADKKVPAVLCPHGHWATGRRSETVQPRSIGLAKLGFLVLAVDAFGSGERFDKPGTGAYHGGGYGAALWPAGKTLLGVQVEENMAAVDYLLSRPEANGRLGVTGASGGGNQSMYLAAVDLRVHAAVPVCSVGSYRAFLKAACCVCEVLPGGLADFDLGEVLGLIAPRSLMMIHAAKDSYQFAPAQAEPTVELAKKLFAWEKAELRQTIVESPHDYNKPMREAMYGFMLKTLAGKGDGAPVPEPEHKPEPVEALAVYSAKRPRSADFVTPPKMAATLAKELVAGAEKLLPKHAEMWPATATQQQARFRDLMGGLNPVEKPRKLAEGEKVREFVGLTLDGEAGPLRGARATPLNPKLTARRKVILHLGGLDVAVRDLAAPAKAWQAEGADVVFVEVRATGAGRPANDALKGMPDHNSAEHALWLGRPLLGMWALDLAEWLVALGGTSCVVGYDEATLPVLGALALAGPAISEVILLKPWLTLDTLNGFSAANTPMGVLAPGLMELGDVGHLMAWAAPRPLTLVGGWTADRRPLDAKADERALAFPRAVYKAVGAADKIRRAEIDGFKG